MIIVNAFMSNILYYVDVDIYTHDIYSSSCLNT